MYRYHQRCEVLYGHFADFIQAIEACNSIARQRGRVEFTPWTPTTGKGNMAVLISDYPDDATFTRQEGEAEADAEFMKAWRRAFDFVVQSSFESETLRPAPHLA